MSSGAGGRRFGWAWLVLLGIPPVLVIAGLAALLIWQGGKGGITPRWKKPLPATNAAPAQTIAP